MHCIEKSDHAAVAQTICYRLFLVVASASLLIILSGITVSGAAEARDRFNGFQIVEPLVPLPEIFHGGPPRDGIPAIDSPRFVSSAEMQSLKPNDRVLGLNYQGETKAYPIRILNYHEIVNDRFGDHGVLISFCPLCGTGMAFKRQIGGDTLSFGVSGLLYNSDVLMYDRKTESLWSQIDMLAISGPNKGTTLEALPVEHTTWSDWHKRFPESLVLDFNTGFQRDYTRTPYSGYEDSRRIYFPVSYEDKRYHPKEIVLGIEHDGVTKAYPFVELAGLKSPLSESINGLDVNVYFDSTQRTGRVETLDGKPYPVLSAFWSAWYAFHPDTAVFKAQ